MIKTTVTNIAKKVLPYSLRIQLRKLNWRKKYLLQKLRTGNQAVYCPIAEKEFSCFIPEKKGIWSSLITPVNGARSRHRLVWLYLKNETEILTAPCKILHIAPEYCFMNRLKKARGSDYIAGDKMVTGYGRQDGVVYMDLLALDLENESVDYVLCNHVLEHIPDDGKAMSEMFRVLRRGGRAIVTVPIDEHRDETYEDFSITAPAEREKHFGQWDHVRWYAKDIKGRLQVHGFEVQLVRYADHYSKEDFRRMGLCQDLLVVAHKPA